MRWHWQYAGAVALYAFNVDWIIMQTLKLLGLGGWNLFVVTSVLSVLELFCGYLFWEWFRYIAIQEFASSATQSGVVQEAIGMGKEIRDELKKADLWDKIKGRVINFLFDTYKQAANPDNRFMRWFKRSGNIGMFACGINPEPGTRTIGAIFCGTAGWKKGLYPLAIGNTLRVAYMVGIWDVIFKLFK